jgi:hypothetical protein
MRWFSILAGAWLAVTAGCGTGMDWEGPGAQGKADSISKEDYAKLRPEVLMSDNEGVFVLRRPTPDPWKKPWEGGYWYVECTTEQRPYADQILEILLEEGHLYAMEMFWNADMDGRSHDIFIWGKADDTVDTRSCEECEDCRKQQWICDKGEHGIFEGEGQLEQDNLDNEEDWQRVTIAKPRDKVTTHWDTKTASLRIAVPDVAQRRPEERCALHLKITRD